jgi:uncharacterized OsmC-like protein
MKISANLTNSPGRHSVVVSTEGNSKSIAIAAKLQGSGSAINGGELLFLSLATCVCNDIYREAAKRLINVDNVEVTVTGEFGKEGEEAKNIVYSVNVDSSSHSAEEIQQLIEHVDAVAEVHATLRKGVKVVLQR